MWMTLSISTYESLMCARGNVIHDFIRRVKIEKHSTEYKTTRLSIYPGLGTLRRGNTCVGPAFFATSFFVPFPTLQYLASLKRRVPTSRADIYKCEHPRCKTPAFKHHSPRCNGALPPLLPGIWCLHVYA